jgi:hypothetical protein
MICASCRTVSACAAVDLDERERRELVVVLDEIRSAASKLEYHHGSDYASARSHAAAERDADARIEAWDRGPLGRLLARLR